MQAEQELVYINKVSGQRLNIVKLTYDNDESEMNLTGGQILQP